jgi:hypothetical protein
VNAVALLAHLETAGVQVSRDGDNLRVRGKPGVSLAPYLEQIRKLKPKLLGVLLPDQPDPPALIWMHVSQEEVDASKPPADWDGYLPDSCGWRSFCQVLGPCPRHLAGGTCQFDGGVP